MLTVRNWIFPPKTSLDTPTSSPTLPRRRPPRAMTVSLQVHTRPRHPTTSRGRGRPVNCSEEPRGTRWWRIPLYTERLVKGRWPRILTVQPRHISGMSRHDGPVHRDRNSRTVEGTTPPTFPRSPTFSRGGSRPGQLYTEDSQSSPPL